MQLNNLSADGSTSYTPERTGEYLLLIGGTEGSNFGGGSLAVSQDGITLDSLGTVTTATRRIVYLRGNKAVTFTLSGSTSPDLNVTIERTLVHTSR